jgi:predicted nucleic acid-binding protein
MEKELILCDTNILISWFKGEEKTISELIRIGLENILLPSITLMEIYQGARNKSELQKIKIKLNSYHIVHINEKSSQIAIELIEKYKLSHGLLIPDAIIAAIALAYDFKIFTYNTKDFQFIPGINLY